MPRPTSRAISSTSRSVVSSNSLVRAIRRPIEATALDETISGPATWHRLPSAALISTDDHSLPTEAQRFMAARAGSAVLEVGASHAVPLSRPAETAGLIRTSVKLGRFPG